MLLKRRYTVRSKIVRDAADYLRPSACSGRERGDVQTEALGRSQNGFKTMIHLRGKDRERPWTGS